MITVTLPYPPPELSPNGGKRWYFHKINRIKNEYKLIAKMAAKYAKPRGHVPWERARTSITYYKQTGRGRPMDQDNALAWLKAGLDGIVLAGLLKDDVGLEHNSVIVKVDKDNPRVEIAFEEIP